MAKIEKTLNDAFWGVNCGYAILQLIDSPEYEDEQFSSLKELGIYGKEPVSEHYELVYSGELEFVPEKEEILLEYLYEKFNVDSPKDFTGHSLSVSDVIAVKSDGIIQFWFVDSIGFTCLNWNL